MGKNIITVASCFFWLLCFPVAVAEPQKSDIEEGKRLTLEFCQACHQYLGTEQAGTVAPPLVGMKQRFPDRSKLYSIIYDPQTSMKKDTMMPPFGRNQLLAKDEIEKVIDFLYSL